MERHTSRRWTRAAAAAAAVTLFTALTACASDDPDETNTDTTQNQTDTGGETGTETGQEQVELTITSPSEGETVSLPFEVTADADVELGSMADRLHHMHVWFDDGEFLVFESDTAQIQQAPEGATTLWVQVHTYDHRPASEPMSVPLTVEGGNGAGGEDSSRNTGPYGNDY